MTAGVEAMTPRAETVPRLFLEAVERFGPRVALREKYLGIWREITWNEYRDIVEAVALALGELGLEHGDRVGIIAENSPRWLFTDVAAQTMGGVPVGIYATNAAPQCRFILEHSGAKFLFVENHEQLDKWQQFRSELPLIEKVVVFDCTGLRNLGDPAVMFFDELVEMGRERQRTSPEEWSRATRQVRPDDPAVLIYTSGTTGDPKGAILTHRNLVWQSRTLASLDRDLVFNPEDEVISFLPLCHIFERLFTGFVPLSCGYVVNFTESVDTVAESMREVAPTIGYGVPRVWEKYHSRIVLAIEEATWLKRTLFGVALRIGRRRAAYALERKPLPPSLSVAWKLAHLVVFRKLRERLGFHRIRFAFSGAAPISPDVLAFFHSIGMDLVEGYGQTEGTGVTTASTLSSFRPGSVGRALPGLEIRIAEDGEILIRSPGVFAGYYRDPAATAQVLDDGWLHSGDVGVLDDDGYLRIVDRKKDIIITAGGKNIAPQVIENKLKFSPYINDAIAIGDGRRFVSALIVLDEENVSKYAREHRVAFSTYADLASSREIVRLVDDEVQKVNRELARVEHVRKFRILPHRLHEEEGDVTPTMKVKRRVLEQKYREDIEAMYGESS
ncbi:MAG TPA: long-chain fatty acid--CoA ligase [Thermoanaerobaculia bacterium]|nr:long-chain fatty acid--CoA ligase [Thermoanaerobaculia bacterium]